ncbi:MAG TPA: MgtC/SapB family protein [Leptolyngbyaceae cyanobacterium]
MFDNYWINLIFRLSLSLLVGGVIGWERELRHKPAGFRTHMLVSFGAAVFVLIAIELKSSQPDADSISRVIQGITTGIGFLGGGEILREGQSKSGAIRIRGLTSAAAIWVSAALGVAAGCGLWQLSLVGTFLCILVLRVFKRWENEA